jgi:hypothetical protein
MKPSHPLSTWYSIVGKLFYYLRHESPAQLAPSIPLSGSSPFPHRYSLQDQPALAAQTRTA